MAVTTSILSPGTCERIETDKLRHCRGQAQGKPLFAERHVRVICIGAGASGLCFAYKLQRSFRNFTLSIYEKNEDISGTWFENRYPGCACDVPAHNYTYSWEPSPTSSAVYVSSQELYQYFKNFSAKHDLERYIYLQHKVVGATWNGKTWRVQAEDLLTGHLLNKECDILVNATGILNNWNWPDIPGLEKFQGKLLHSANWDTTVSLDNKSVGLIGNGSSGIQILPAIQPRVKKLTTFIRGPTWVSPSPGLQQHIYTPSEKTLFSSSPSTLLALRKLNETATNCLFGTFVKNSATQHDTRADLTKQMHTRLNSPQLASALIPSWSPGCRRLTPGVNYLESLTKPNVQVSLGSIRQVTETGVVGPDGTHYDFDVLICATGFNVSFRPRFPIINGPRNNTNLQDLWANDPKCYFGTAVADMPNYMLFLGPNCPVGNGPLLPVIETQADYMLKWIDRWQTENNMRCFHPKTAAVDEFVDYVNTYMPRTVWTEGCRSWYKDERNGRVVALWPGSSLHFMETMQEVRGDDWTVEYEGNRYSWMGNGYSQTETDPRADWAYYIRNEDDGPLIGKGKRREQLVRSAGTEVKNGGGGVDHSNGVNGTKIVNGNGTIAT